MRIPPSVKLLLARSSAATDINGTAFAKIKIPGAFALDSFGNPVSSRTISGGWAYFQNQADGDYVYAEVRDDDNHLGLGVGYVLDSFDDQDLPAGNRGWFFPRQQVLELRPLVSDDPTDLPSAMYLYIIAQKANIATADTLYVNVHWGITLR